MREVKPSDPLSIELSEGAEDQLRDLQESTGAASMSEVMRRALALYQKVTRFQAAGGVLVFRKDGADRRLRGPRKNWRAIVAFDLASLLGCLTSALYLSDWRAGVFYFLGGLLSAKLYESLMNLRDYGS